MNIDPINLVFKLDIWLSKPNKAESTKKLEELIDEVKKVPFESGFCKDLHDRLDKVQKVLQNPGEGEHEELKLKINKVKEHIFPKMVSKRLALCKMIAKQGEDSTIALANNFEKLALEKASVLERLALCKVIAEQGEWAVIALGCNFEKLGFLTDLQNCKDLRTRLALCKMMAEQGEWASRVFVWNFEKLGLEEASVSDRLTFCKMMAEQGTKAARALANNFDKLGFLTYLLNCTGPKTRLARYKEIAEQGEWAARGLADNFDKLGFLTDIQNCKDLKARLALCKMVAEQGEWAAKGLADNFDKLGLERTSVSGRLALCKVMADQGTEGARALAKNFDKLGLEKAMASERLALCKMIAEQGTGAAAALVYNFDKLGLEKAMASERLALCKMIAEQGLLAAEALVNNFDKLGLEKASVLERLALCKVIAEKGEWAAKGLADNFEKLGFERASVSDCLALCKMIAEQGTAATRALARKFEKLKFDNSEKIQILFELLTLPTEIRNEFKGLINKSDDKVKPFLSLLLQEESDFDSKEFKEFESRIAKTPIASIYEKIKQQKAHRLQLSKWAAYTAGVFFNMENEKIEAIKTSEILDCIYHHQIPSNRFAFVRQLKKLECKDLEEMPNLELKKTKKNIKKQKRSDLSWILLSRLKQIGFEKDIKSTLSKINGVSGFSDTKRFDFLVQLLLLVIEEQSYKEGELETIEKAILKALTKEKLSQKERSGRRKKDIEVISNKLNAMSNIWTIFGKEELINCLESEKDIQSFFHEKFQTLFELENIDDFVDRYQKTFGDFRDKTALFSYLRSVKKLPSRDRKKVKSAFSEYVSSVLNGTFPGIRYDVDKSPHLKTLFEKREDLKEIWMCGKEPQKVAKNEKSKPLQMDYKSILKEKILTDRHLNPDDFPYLRDYLRGKEVKPKNLDDPKVKFQTLAIALCEGKKPVKGFISEVEELKLSLGEFANDLVTLVPKKSYGEYTISESDDPCDLLLIGTEIQGSCQRVNESPGLNKCLIGYIMNGEIRPIVLKKGDKLVARSLLRLMWDDKNNTPVLLQERLYSNVQDVNFNEAIQAWAIEKAKKMKIPLVSNEIGSGESYDGTVKFLGGRAPFVYSDASGGVLSGAFETSGCHLLYSPPKTQ